MTITAKLVPIVLAAICMSGGAESVAVCGVQNDATTSNTVRATTKHCPAREVLQDALGNASSMMEQAKYRDAVTTLQPLATLDCDPRVSLLLAAALEAGGDAPQAEETLRKAHAVWPTNTSIAASLAREYLASNHVQEAVTALSSFHATAATPAQELELAAVVFLAGHRLTSAQAVAEVAYKAHPSVHSLLLLANSMQLQGRFKDVVRLLSSQRSTYGQSPDFLITLAESEYDEVLYDTARDDLEHAVALDPNSYPAHLLLGNVWVKLNDTGKAAAAYRSAIALAPNQPRAYYQLALVMQTEHDEAEAEKMLQQALAADNHYAPAHVELGRMLLTQNYPSDAVGQLNLAIEDNPSSEQAYYLLARAYAQLGDKSKSDAMAKRLIAVRNANSQINANRSEGEGIKPAATP